jgi:hypothetical protein
MLSRTIRQHKARRKKTQKFLYGMSRRKFHDTVISNDMWLLSQLMAIQARAKSKEVVPAASDPEGRSSRSAGLLRNRTCGRTTTVIHWLLVRHVPKSALRHSQYNQIIALGAESVQCSGCEIILSNLRSTAYSPCVLQQANCY